MSAQLDPLARIVLDRRLLVASALKSMDDATAIRFAKMNDAQFETAVKIVQDTALKFCGWGGSSKWN